MKLSHIQIELRIAILYAIFGGAWILFSDFLLNKFVADHTLYARFQTYKGWFFVAASATLIFYFIKQEITKRNEIDEKLRVSERRYRGLFEHMTEGYAYCKMLFENDQAIDWVYLKVNEAFETLTGLKEAEGKQVSEIIPGIRTSDPELFEIYSRVALTGRPEKFEIFLEALKMWFSVSVYSPEKEYFVAVFDVITERKRAEEEITNLSKFPTENPNPVLRFHNDGQVTYANAASQGLLEMWGCGVNGYLPAEMKRSVADTAESDSIKVVDVPCNDKVYSLMMVPVPEGGYVNLYGRDITGRKHTEEKLRRTLDDLRRSNAELEQFAYVASHDLQEPLRSVAGLVQLLQHRYQGQLDSRADEYIEHIVDGTQRMHALINDLLAYSRIGQRGEPIQVIESEAALQATLENLNLSIQEYEANITNDSLPTVRADLTQLIQLFQNLIGNALKFRGERPPQIHVGVTDVGQFWQFSVHDNGIGIEPEYFERVFQVFQRLHTRREYKGTGIGLAICKKIIERHGGYIWVESEMGQGSTFYFTLLKGD